MCGVVGGPAEGRMVAGERCPAPLERSCSCEQFRAAPSSSLTGRQWSRLQGVSSGAS